MEEKIKAKLAELAAQKEQTLAQLNAILGAEQALKQIIAENSNSNQEG